MFIAIFANANILNSEEVFRMYAKSHRAQPSEKIKPASNQIEGVYEFPSLEYLYQFPVVICTLQTAGCISRARDKNPNFKSDHFSHVIIDEAASVQMSIALIAIAG